ncbi:MAG: hypothetical protein ACUVTD_00820 [Nitrososphaerales archaeon]
MEELKDALSLFFYLSDDFRPNLASVDITWETPTVKMFDEKPRLITFVIGAE